MNALAKAVASGGDEANVSGEEVTRRDDRMGFDRRQGRCLDTFDRLILE